MRGKVEICGINTADLKVLKNDEMMALLRRCREGDKSAREQLICGNLRLVLSVIQRFLGRGENVDDLLSLIHISREQLMSQNQREPTVEQIAAQLGIPREEVVMAMDAIVDPVSLYEPVYSDAGDNVCVMDQVRDSNNSDEHWLEQISLKDAIARLDKRQRNILALRFCQGKTQMEVSSEIGISQAQVSRLEKGAIACIKREM